MADQPVRAYQPLLRTQMDTRFYCFPETTETAPCLSNNLPSEDGRVRQKERRREDPENGRNPSKRQRISSGPHPQQVEEVEKADDSSEANEDSGMPGSLVRSWDSSCSCSGSCSCCSSGTCSGTCSSGSEESSDHSSGSTSSLKPRLNTGQID